MDYSEIEGRKNEIEKGKTCWEETSAVLGLRKR